MNDAGADNLPQSMETYDVHDNGGRPFRVTVEGHVVRVYCLDDDGPPQREPSLTIAAERVFVEATEGHPLNASSRGGCGKHLRGNTVLVELGPAHAPNSYVWIGNAGVQMFTAKQPLIEFESPIGPNDVPYPWAKDIGGNYYLLSEWVVLTAHDRLDVEMLKARGPYDYYYNNSGIVCDRRAQAASVLRGFEGIVGFSVGDEELSLCYEARAAENYDRFADGCEGGMPKVARVTGETAPLTREDYIRLMGECGKFAGFEPIAYAAPICERGETAFAVSEL